MDNLDVPALLKRAKSLISKKQRWLKNRFAMNYDTMECRRVDDSDADCFCLYGALQRACYETGNIKNASILGAILLFPKIEKKSMDVQVTAYNDAEERTHAEVMALFDAALVRYSQDKT